MSEFPVTAIRSVDLGVPDVTRAEAFYVETWGLAVVAREGSAVYLRATGRDHHVLALHAHPEAEILSVSFRVQSVETLEQIAVQQSLRADGRVIATLAPNSEPDGGMVVKCRESGGICSALSSWRHTTRSE